MDNRLLQLEELEMLRYFSVFCEKHQLRYYITAGTLLGAVRHKGFIPWDDDIDVLMPRADFDRLEQLCKEHLAAEYFFQNDNTDQNYPFLFAKIRKNGTFVNEAYLDKVQMHKGVYIDIFPLDICPDRSRCAAVYFKWVEQLQCALMAQVNPDFVCGYRKGTMRIGHRVLRTLPRNTLKFLWRISRKSIAALSSNNRLCTVCASHGYPRETYEKAWFEKTEQLPFEGSLFPAPAGWHALLENMYGDYMMPPSEQERQGHFE